MSCVRFWGFLELQLQDVLCYILRLSWTTVVRCLMLDFEAFLNHSVRMSYVRFWGFLDPQCYGVLSPKLSGNSWPLDDPRILFIGIQWAPALSKEEEREPLVREKKEKKERRKEGKKERREKKEEKKKKRRKERRGQRKAKAAEKRSRCQGSRRAEIPGQKRPVSEVLSLQSWVDKLHPNSRLSPLPMPFFPLPSSF